MGLKVCLFVCLRRWEGVACEEDVRKQRSRGGFRGKEVRTVVVVSSSVWVECLEQRSASSAFYWTHSTSALRTKATTKLTDESQMSRQSSKEASWPRTYTHTHYRLPLQRVERIETRGFVGGSSARLHAP